LADFLLNLGHYQSYWVIALGFIVTLACSLALGYGSGLLAGLVTAFVVDYNYIEPQKNLFNTPASYFNLVLFCSISLGIATMVAGLRDAFKKSEKALNSAENAVKSRDHVISVVSHDLKNPLATIVLNTELMIQSQNRTSTDPAFKRRIDNILMAAERIKKIIQDLLDALKSDIGELTVVMSSENPKSLVQETFNGFEARAEAKGVRLTWSVDENLPFVLCDYGRILQVLSNLVDNALKFTPSGGSIQIKAGIENGSVSFSVIDSGVGISKEKVSYVFNRYWQVNGASREGVGLGLFISKGIVNSHHGTISLKSTPGVGTTVNFTLPIAPQDQIRPPKVA
jgi:signal transduction histidine kinase